MLNCSVSNVIEAVSESEFVDERLSINRGHLVAQNPAELDVLFHQLLEYETTQLRSGTPAKEVHFCASANFITFHSVAGSHLYKHGTVLDNRFMIAIPDREVRSSKWWGRQINDGELPCLYPGSELELMEDEGQGHVILAWNLAPLFEMAGSSQQTQQLASFLGSFSSSTKFLVDSLGISSSWYHFFRDQIMGFLSGEESIPPHRWEEMGSGFLISLIESAEGHGIDAIGMARSREIVHRAIQHDEANLTSACSIPAICGRLKCSQRTLELAFRNCTGTSPLQFLTRRRLNVMHRLLRNASPKETSVTDVALSVGFTHFGRAAGLFKDMFQAKPSEVLKQTRVTSGLTIAFA